MRKAHMWVGGWLTQIMLLAFAASAITLDRLDAAVTFVVGSSIIGVIRQIEKERRGEQAARQDEVEP